MTTDRTTAPTATFDERLAVIEAATPDPDGRVEIVARAIAGVEMRGEVTPIDWRAALDDDDRAWYRDMAQAAIHALKAPAASDPTAALRRVEALAAELEREANSHELTAETRDEDDPHYSYLLGRAHASRGAAKRIRAALSSPAGPDADGDAAE